MHRLLIPSLLALLGCAQAPVRSDKEVAMAKVRSGQAQIGSASIHYELRGSGPAVLFIPGATGDAGHFQRVAELLSNQFTVVTYDRRGNSRSTSGGASTSLDQQADDAAELLRQLGISRPVVFGTSGGAIIALKLALRHPDVPSKVLLHEPPFLQKTADAGPLQKEFEAQVGRALQSGGPRGAMEAFIRMNAGDAVYERLDPALRERMLKNGEWFFGQELPMFTSWAPTPDELRSLKVPVRVVLGEESAGEPPHQGGEWLAKQLDQVPDVLPGHHGPYFSEPDEMAAELRPMLSDAPPTMHFSIRGHGEPLVLVGGGLTGMQSWAPFQAVLMKDRRVIRAQLLAVQYGIENRRLPEGYSVTTEAAALGNALDAAGVTGPVDIVAWSFGAFTTLTFALDHPERIRTLTLIEPPAFWVAKTTGHADAQTQSQIETMTELYRQLATKGEVTASDLESFCQQAALIPPGKRGEDLPQWPNWLMHRRSLLMGTAPYTYMDDPRRLSALKMPVLLVKGTGSSHFLHAIIDALQERLPNARTIELPGGHAPQIVAMDRFLEELRAFQQGNAAAPLGLLGPGAHAAQPSPPAH